MFFMLKQKSNKILLKNEIMGKNVKKQFLFEKFPVLSIISEVEGKMLSVNERTVGHYEW